MDHAPLLIRHVTGSASQVSGYVAACHALDAVDIAAEYRDRVASAPTRSSPYIVDHNISNRSEVSSRREELLAHRMFELGTTLGLPGWEPTRIVDFQVPLNAKRSDGLEKVDLLGVGEGLCVIELKVDGSGPDTPLNALLEGVGYAAVVEANVTRIVGEVQARGHGVDVAQGSVLVLGPEDYWARWDRTRIPVDWRGALRVAGTTVSSATGLRIGFGSFDAGQVGPSMLVNDVLD